MFTRIISFTIFTCQRITTSLSCIVHIMTHRLRQKTETFFEVFLVISRVVLVFMSRFIMIFKLHVSSTLECFDNIYPDEMLPKAKGPLSPNLQVSFSLCGPQTLQTDHCPVLWGAVCPLLNLSPPTQASDGFGLLRSYHSQQFGILDLWTIL